MDWRTLTIADLNDKGFMYQTTTDGWQFLLMGFVAVALFIIFHKG